MRFAWSSICCDVCILKSYLDDVITSDIWCWWLVAFRIYWWLIIRFSKSSRCLPKKIVRRVVRFSVAVLVQHSCKYTGRVPSMPPSFCFIWQASRYIFLTMERRSRYRNCLCKIVPEEKLLKQVVFTWIEETGAKLCSLTRCIGAFHC